MSHFVGQQYDYRWKLTIICHIPFIHPFNYSLLCSFIKQIFIMCLQMPDTLLGAGELDMDARNKVPALKK